MQVICGQCRGKLEIDDAYPGGEVACPQCHRQVYVPRLDAGMPAEAAPDQQTPDEAGFAVQAKKGMARKVRVVCGRCNKQLTISARRSGKTAICPGCKGRIHIPFPDDAQEFELSAAPEMEEVELDAEDTSEAWVPHTELADALKPVPELTQAVEAARGPLRFTAIQRRTSLLGCLWPMVAAGLFAAGSYWLYLEYWPKLPQPVDTQPAAGATDVPKEPIGRRPEEQVPASPDVPEVVTPVQPAAMKILNVARDAFAAGGYRPARPGWMYWKVTVQLTAGSAAALDLSAPGPAVAIKAPGRQYPALGVPAGGGVLPAQAAGFRAQLAPLASQTVTFLFEAPESLPAASLAVAGVGEEPLGRLPGVDPASIILAGTYVESPPRNLKPLLRDPVMAAIQAVPNQRLIVAHAASGYEVSIPAAGVAGAAVMDANGLFSAVLKHNGSSLSCKLRLVDGGKQLILYLSDDPFHQITYVRG